MKFGSHGCQNILKTTGVETRANRIIDIINFIFNLLYLIPSTSIFRLLSGNPCAVFLCIFQTVFYMIIDSNRPPRIAVSLTGSRSRVHLSVYDINYKIHCYNGGCDVHHNRLHDVHVAFLD